MDITGGSAGSKPLRRSVLVIDAGSETTRSSRVLLTEFLDSRLRLQRKNERRWKNWDGDVLAVVVRGVGACWSVRGGVVRVLQWCGCGVWHVRCRNGAEAKQELASMEFMSTGREHKLASAAGRDRDGRPMESYWELTVMDLM